MPRRQHNADDDSENSAGDEERDEEYEVERLIESQDEPSDADTTHDEVQSSPERSMNKRMKYDQDDLMDSGDSEELEQDSSNCDAENNPIETESTNADESSLFMCSLAVSVREFKGQTSAGELDTWLVCGNSVDEFLKEVWMRSKKYLVREIVRSCNDNGDTIYSWSANEEVQESDFLNFALFYDKENRRTHPVDKVTSNILKNWRSKSQIELLIHKYSLAVNSKAVWKKVEKTLIDTIPKNRAGAATTQYANDLASELRKKHGHVWKGHDIAWSIWANAILSAPPDQHATMISESMPPASCLDLFVMQERESIQRIRKEYQMAHNVNDGYQEEVKKLVAAFQEVKDAQKTLTLKISVFERHLENLALRSQLGESFLSSAESALNVKESSLSVSIASKVQDCDDVDHT